MLKFKKIFALKKKSFRSFRQKCNMTIYINKVHML